MNSPLVKPSTLSLFLSCQSISPRHFYTEKCPNSFKLNNTEFYCITNGRNLRKYFQKEFSNEDEIRLQVSSRLRKVFVTNCTISTKPKSFLRALDEQCGKVKVLPDESRIYGGQEAIENNYNWVVIVVSENKNGHRGHS